ncbi:spermatogenesis-associated serine-rich protein 2 [Patella vulgata]|uniref:spermatogenesis-associated serine-rich protein 2 n=1 Tax=Patella vulgata TaxID=6465 RepID=UPI0024A7DE02|nr:spermatogenesis-associated serine-rich protein 2 [Patella vulgata]
MARKNFRADNSAIIHFDSRTNTVMAQSTTSHNHVKQKTKDPVKKNVNSQVTAVREVVPGRAFDEIVLVLQYYDYNSEKAIQAYLEDGAKEALQQWHFSGTKAQNKKKRPRKGRAEEGGGGTSPDPNSSPSVNSNNNNIDKPHMLNGDHTKDISDQARIPAANYRDQQQSYPEKSRPLSHPNNTSLDRRDKVQLIGSKSSEMNQRDKQQRSNNNNSSQKNSGNNSSIAASQEARHQRIRTISECSSSSLTSGPEHFTIKKAGLERSVKDLQRQQSSLERLRRTFEEEVDKGPKKIKSVFEEVRKALYDRELQMIIEFEQMKLESRDLFIMRQQKASELKTKIDRADCMNENELTDLRADVKHFVSERRLDEDLANTTRFMYDTDNIIGVCLY